MRCDIRAFFALKFAIQGTRCFRTKKPTDSMQTDEAIRSRGNRMRTNQNFWNR